jgi:hypothetical protein
MRILALVVLLAAGCAQAPTTAVPDQPQRPLAAAAHELHEVRQLSFQGPAPDQGLASAKLLAATAAEWRGGVELEALRQDLDRVRELRAELRGGYERAVMRLRGTFTLPSSWKKPATGTEAGQAGPFGPAWAGEASWSPAD